MKKLFVIFALVAVLFNGASAAEAASSDMELHAMGNELYHVYIPSDNMPEVKEEFKSIALVKNQEVYFAERDGEYIKLSYDGDRAIIYEASDSESAYVKSNKNPEKYVKIADRVFSQGNGIRQSQVLAADKISSKEFRSSDFI